MIYSWEYIKEGDSMGNIQKIKPSGIFTNYIFKSIPLAFDESLSYYEMLCGVLDLLKTQEEVINNNADLLAELESYVKNYFENLDVQEEINNKLDEMALDGTLENLIGQYIELQTTFTYNTVNEMKNATNLVNGSFAKTTGFYSYNDGGGAYYKVRQMTNEDIIDNIFLISLNDPLLIAELQYNNELDYLQCGGKINDNTYDSTDLVQLMIDTLSSKKCGKIYFPQGRLYFKGTITLKSNVELIGYGDYSTWNINSETGQDKATTFYHIADEESNFITSNYLDTSELNYQPNINIKNLYIVGDSNTKNGLYLVGISKSVIENIMIINCQNNIHIEYAMTTDFIRIFSQRATDYCLLIDSSKNLGQSTTTNFYNCYFGQTRESGGSPMKIDYRSIVGCNFVDCTFETSNESIEIDTYNEVYFTNIYCENIPDSNTKPMFKIGTSPTTVTGEKGVISINGGTIYGCGTWYEASNKATIFDVDNINNLSIIGCTLRRADYTLKLTNNTDRITYIGNTEGQIANGINTYKSSNKILYLNCNNTSFPIVDRTFIPKSQMTLTNITLQNGWTAYGTGLQYATFGNLVSLYVSCNSGQITNGTVIGTLPDGYRPASPVRIFLQNLSDDAYLDTSNYLMVKTNGDIRIVGSGFVTNKVYVGNVTFLVK